jgi:hypothetical protein
MVVARRAMSQPKPPTVAKTLRIIGFLAEIVDLNYFQKCTDNVLTMYVLGVFFVQRRWISTG